MVDFQWKFWFDILGLVLVILELSILISKHFEPLNEFQLFFKIGIQYRTWEFRIFCTLSDISDIFESKFECPWTRLSLNPFSWILSQRSFYSKELNTMATERKMFVTVLHVYSCPFMRFHYYLNLEPAIISFYWFLTIFHHNHGQMHWMNLNIEWFFKCAYDIIILITFDMSWSVSYREGWLKYRCNIVQKGFRKSLDVPHDITSTQRDIVGIRAHINGHLVHLSASKCTNAYSI